MRLNRYGWLACALLAALPAQAQEDNAQRAMQKLQFMLRQTSSEKAALQQQVDELNKQVQQLTQQLADAKSNAAEGRKRLEERLSGAAAQWQQRDEKMSQQVSATQLQLKEQSQQRARLEQQLQQQTENFNLCYANNQKLYDINRELLSSYRSKGVMDAVKQKEPFTGIEQVKVENLIQETQYKLDDLNLSLGGLKAPTDEGP